MEGVDVFGCFCGDGRARGRREVLGSVGGFSRVVADGNNDWDMENDALATFQRTERRLEEVVRSMGSHGRGQDLGGTTIFEFRGEVLVGQNIVRLCSHPGNCRPEQRTPAADVYFPQIYLTPRVFRIG